MRRGRTGWTVFFPQFGLNAHCFEAKSNRSSLKACPNQFKALSLLRIRFSFSPLGNRDDIFPQPPSVSTMSTKGNGQNRFGDFRFPRAGGTDACLSPICSVGRPFADPCRPPACCNSSCRGTTSATHAWCQARNALACGRVIQAFAVRDAAFASVSPPFTEILVCTVQGRLTRPRAAWRATISEPVTPRAEGGGAVRPVSELCGKRALCADWVLCGGSPRRFQRGPKMFFAQHLLGADGKSG